MTNAALYRHWIDERDFASLKADTRIRGCNVPVRLRLPDDQGFFWRGTVPCLLPYLRVYWKADRKANRTVAAPPWMAETWKRLEGDSPTGDDGNGGFYRFLRADQLLDCIHALLDDSDNPERFIVAVRAALEACLVTLDEPLRDHPKILSRRVETVRLRLRGEQFEWRRRARFLPDELRRSVIDGLDPIHTPENAHAGLTRYLCEGWEIDDNGHLVPGTGAMQWGPSATCIPHRLHDGPRRLMLGASLQSRSVSLVDSERPTDADMEMDWLPPGRSLRASLTMCGGWTHEDAVVLSESAANKLARHTVRVVRVRIPAVATRVEVLEPSDGAVHVRHGQSLVRAFVDAFALGLSRRQAEDDGADDGWIEVAIPGALAPIDGELQRPTRRALHTPFWREMITFEIERIVPVAIGDKLSTRHGIKGVVSHILPDAEMPPAGNDPAEIVVSPLGIARRGAMGQFREAAPAGSAELPKAGPIFVMRQPQDANAPERCRVRGPEQRNDERLPHGQRYGEMEFWALMAHGAREIAKELLSVERSTASWVAWEAKIGSGDNRKLATRALNRYLAIAGVQIHGGRFVSGKEPPGVFEINPKWRASGDPRDKLEDAQYFCERGGLGRLPLGRTVTVALDEEDDDSPTIELDSLYVLPPWLRPSSPFQRHELTCAYWSLMNKLAWPWSKHDDIDRAVKRCVRLILDDRHGAGGFLRREVLGRRLTRSARAVIVPRPDLRIDEIAIPSWMVDRLFEGLPASNRRLVLVNRNPTLHRRGLLALRPVIDPSHPSHVFGLPLGILRALNADFDGDQASVVALETDEALAEAERLLPGASRLRNDPFRPGHAAFPFAGELADPTGEEMLACDGSSTQEDWCEQHQELQNKQLASLNDGWQHPLVTEGSKKSDDLWRGMREDTWRTLATDEMDKILLGVRRKGQLGGVLRRELYRRPFTDHDAFWCAIQALQAVTERMTQTALSVKTGAGVTTFNPRQYFDDPAGGKELLAILDERLDADILTDALGAPTKPSGLLAWMAKPNAHTLLTNIEAKSSPAPIRDPRIVWFLA